jgi:outer membrane protein assembly factor BamB
MTARRLAYWLVALAALVPSEGGRAQETTLANVPGESRTTARRLEEVRRRLGAREWTEALDELQNILDTAGNDLVAVTPLHLVEARRLVQQELARLPAEALRQYRGRVETRARKLLDQGKSERSTRHLQRVVEEAFASRAAESALDLLGDLAFERGDFDEAARWWTVLLPAAPVKEKTPGVAPLTYPDSQLDPARTQAKVLLAHWFGSRREGWAEELKAYREKYPKAEGKLGGRTGLYAELVVQLTLDDHSAPPAAEDWGSFAGGPARQSVLPEGALAPDALGQLVSCGSTHLAPERRAEDADRSVEPRQAARSLAFHPVITKRHVVWCDARHIRALSLQTGKAEVWYDLSRDHGGTPDLQLPALPDLRYTLTLAGDCVLARLGAQDIKPPTESPKPVKPRDTASFLVCLGLPTEQQPASLRWLIKLDDKQGGTFFEGTPIVHESRVLAAVTRFEGNQIILGIHCYALDSLQTPALLWKQDVCSTRQPRSSEPRRMHHLLTLAGANVVCATHSGAIVALDAATGRRVWAVRYPSREISEDHLSARDLAPCVFADGRLYAAPADRDVLLCLDPHTGQTIWERDAIEVVHLLGVGEGRLIFTTMTPRAGLRAIDAATGFDQGGWYQPSDSGKRVSHGRGVLAGNVVYWPTAYQDPHKLPQDPQNRTLFQTYVVRQSDGDQPGDPTETHKLRVGNMVFGHGCLAVADREYLEVYVPASTPREKRDEERGRKSAESVPILETCQGSNPNPNLMPFSIATPLRRRWDVTQNSRQLRAAFDEDQTLVGIGRGELQAYGNAGQSLWQTSLREKPRWLEGEAGFVVVGGSDGVSCFAKRDGARVWDHAKPALNKGRGDNFLHEYRLNSERIFFLQGYRRLWCIPVGTGEIAWAQWAPSAFLYPCGGSFVRHYHAGERALVIQTAGRVAWVVESRKGTLLWKYPCDALWTAPPLGLDQDSITFPLSKKQITLIDAATGKERWTHNLANPSTLTGELPQLAGHGDVLLVLASRNHGFALQRLDVKTGKPVWPREVLLSATPSPACAWAVGDEAVYLATDRLLALSLADGKQIWEQPLPEAGPWRVQLGREVVFALPERPEQRFSFRWHNLTLEWGLRGSRRLSPVPVQIHDRATGRLCQRLNFEDELPRLSGRVSILGRVVWASRDDPTPGPTLVLGAKQAVFLHGRRAWGLGE